MNSISVPNLGGVHPRRGLVQQEDLRARRERAGYFQFSLVAVRQVPGEFLPAILEGEDRKKIHRLFPCPPFLPVERPGTEQCRGSAVPDVRVVGDPHVVDDRQFPEETDILKRSARSRDGRSRPAEAP